ncbi:L-aspartate oxidase [Segnochrobactraceae bacterium EtOH-i3]
MVQSSATVAPGATPADVVIVGGGLAGLFTALKFGDRPVTLLAAAPLGEGSGSAWAQGGIAAAVGVGDSAEKHAADTVAVGVGLTDPAVALSVVSDGPDRISDLLSYGVPFDRDLAGALVLSREAAHSERRVVRVNGDLAGKAIIAALIAAVRATPTIRVVEGLVAERLVLAAGRVAGLEARRAEAPDLGVLFFPARAVVLATGGIGQLYGVTTNPVEACGHGLGLAARAGAVVADAEFVQFHPTALDFGKDPALLATEALRGEGSWLVNRAGERFMLARHPLAELAPRDVVARGVFAEVTSGRGAFLDTRPALGDAIESHFPTFFANCLEAVLDPRREPIPVVPAEHYHMGGLLTDARGRTSIPGLWACGEVASTGLHGANRLASNALLESVVFGARVAADICTLPPAALGSGRAEHPASDAPAITPPEAARRLAGLRALMSRCVGVVRDGDGLAEALTELAALDALPLSERDRNRLAAAKLVTAAAWNRRESRGAHCRADCPAGDPALARRTRLTLGEADALVSTFKDPEPDDGSLAGTLAEGPK